MLTCHHQCRWVLSGGVAGALHVGVWVTAHPVKWLADLVLVSKRVWDKGWQRWVVAELALGMAQLLLVCDEEAATSPIGKQSC